MFRCLDAGVVRAVTHPPLPPLPHLPSLSGDPATQAPQWTGWLRQVWPHPWVAEAISIASPDLARRVAGICAERPARPADVRRAVAAVARYLLRATSRPTPFGVFAGVGPVRLGPAAGVRVGPRHVTATRVEATWLAALVTVLESSPPLMARVPVVANNLAFVRGDRLVLGGRQCVDATGRDVPTEVTVRHTPAVQAAMAAASTPVTLAVLADKVGAAYPGVTRPRIEAMLRQLVAHRLLVSSLHPPMTVADALGHVIDQVSAAGGDTIAGIAAILGRLRVINRMLAEHDQLPVDAYRQRRQLRAAATAASGAVIAAPGQRLAVTQRLDAELVLPPAVTRAAQAAAAVLTRLAPRPAAAPGWRRYHERFTDRYGIGALVPVLELVNPETGLGLPDGYRDRPDQPPEPLCGRDRKLLTLAQRAALTRTVQVALDDAAVTDLAGDPDPEAPPLHTELVFQIHAPHVQALSAGDFDLSVVTVCTTGVMTGRFLPVFDEDDRARMAAAYAALPTVEPGAQPAQVVCPPMYALADNVARVPPVLPATIPVGQHLCGPSVIALDDLAVGATGDRLYLLQPSTRRLVEAATFNAIEARTVTHPVARFLAEVSTSHTAAPSPFAWGAAAALPFLPRIRYGQVILSPARWRLSRSDLPPRSCPQDEWSRRLAAWRQECCVADRVMLGDTDVVIRLDLTDPTQQELLREHLDRHATAVLTEAPPRHAFGWLDGRAHEIVLPLVPDQHRRSAVTPPHPRSLTGRRHGHLPATGDWLYAKIYAGRTRHTEILTRHLPALLDGWDDHPPWWYLRYTDPAPHLRLRFRLPTAEAFGAVAARIAAWVDTLRLAGMASRLQLDTYHPELGRYGPTPAAMAAAHDVFAADSQAAIVQLATPGLHPQAATAASMTAIAAGLLGGHDPATAWLAENIPRTLAATTPPPRTTQRQAIDLADPADERAALTTIPGGQRIAAAWRRRGQALAAYRAHLDADSPGVDQVLTSLLHMHHVRMIGIDDGCGQQCHRLARTIALSHRRPAAAGPR